jgi:16S rRNA (guanine527-N7)-methyltransferase
MDVPLAAVLEDARERGFFGPGPVRPQAEHAEALVALLDDPSGPFLDLGSGGGLPGLTLALAWPSAEGVLLDANTRRTAFLTDAVRRLGLDDRIRVVNGRAEAAARDASLRSIFALVVARSFAAPAVTAECAVGFLHPGGHLVVSEPPDPDVSARWPADGRSQLGLTAPEIRHGGGATAAILELPEPVADRWPRRTGIPAKRPLWST